jgi:hypothetical protein
MVLASDPLFFSNAMISNDKLEMWGDVSPSLRWYALTDQSWVSGMVAKPGVSWI